MILHPQGWPVARTDPNPAPPPDDSAQTPQPPPVPAPATAPPGGAQAVPTPEPIRPAPAIPAPATPTPATPPPSQIVFPPSIYRSPAPNRGPAEWGKTDWPTESAKRYPGIAAGRDTPTPHESYKVIQQSNENLSRFGSGAVRQHASVAAALAGQFAPFLDALSRGAFSSRYSGAVRANMEAQLQNLKITQEQMLMQSEEAVRVHQQEMLAYGRIFELHRINELSDEQAKEAALDIARQTNHPYLMATINDKGIKGAWDLLSWEDAQMRQSEAGNTTLRKATAGQTDADEAAEFGDTSASGGGAGLGAAGGFRLPSAGEDAGPQTASAAETDAGAEQENFDDHLKKHEYTPDQVSAIHGILNDEPPDAYKGLNKKGAQYHKISKGALEGQATIDHELQGEGTPDEKLARVESTDQGVADTLRGLHDYTIDPKELGSIKNRPRYIKMMASLDPKWKEGNYAIVQKYHDPNKVEGMRVQRVASLDQHLWSLNNVLERIPETDKVPPRVMKAWIAGHYSGDPTWDELYGAIRNVAVDTLAIETGGNRPPVTLINDMVRHMLPTSSPASIRAQAMIDMRGAYGQIHNLRSQFRSEIGNPNAELPFLDRETNNKYLAWLRANPYTGEMPPDAPSSMLAISKKPGATLLPGLVKTTPDRPGMELRPLTVPEIRQGWDKLDEYKKTMEANPSDQETPRLAQWLRMRLGMFADRDSI